MPYEVLDHTADVRFRVRGRTLAGAFAEAARAVCETMAPNCTPAGVVRYAGADHILMYCERNLKGENSVMKAISVDESKSVPAWKFAPPPGYAEQETHF